MIVEIKLLETDYPSPDSSGNPFMPNPC